MFKGLPSNSCHCPHMGFVLEGSIRIVFDDGPENFTKAGDVLHWHPNNTARADENIIFLYFSPEAELAEVMEQVSKNLEKIT